MAEHITIQHTASAKEWALSEDRIPVFTVMRDEPNPQRGQLLDPQPEGQSGAIDERETIPVAHTFTMPAKPNPGLALKYMRMAKGNPDGAAAYLLELAIGEEGYEALADELEAEGDTDKAFATMRNVIQFVAKRVMGGLGKA